MTIDLRLGNCSEILKAFPAESIDLTVTSPPYDKMRNYNGYSFSFESIAEDILRVTKKWWGIGMDS